MKNVLFHVFVDDLSNVMSLGSYFHGYCEILFLGFLGMIFGQWLKNCAVVSIVIENFVVYFVLIMKEDNR